MIVRAIKTHKIRPNATTMTEILDMFITNLPERSIVAITAKIISLCEGRAIKIETISREARIDQKADDWLAGSRLTEKFGTYVKDNQLALGAGITTSNTNGFYVLWPRDAYASARAIRDYLARRFSLEAVGVIILAGNAGLMRGGAVGGAIGYAGFEGIRDYTGYRDVFGGIYQGRIINQVDGLAAAAASVMGGADQQTPLAVIRELKHITFNAVAPTLSERAQLAIELPDPEHQPLLSGRVRQPSISQSAGNKKAPTKGARAGN